MTFNVSTLPHLNLLGQTAIRKLDIDICALLQETGASACIDEISKSELGCLKNFELEVAYKDNVKPVPFAILEDLNHAYDAGIKTGVWVPAQFNKYGTPVVPIMKKRMSGQQGTKLRMCGNNSVTVNQQLVTHGHPLPLSEDLMHKLSGGYYTKIDLANAYNQIKLAPDSQNKLAPIAVFLEDVLVSGASAEERLHNLHALLYRLRDKGLCCNREKCAFAQSAVEYLGHTLSRHGIAKGPDGTECHIANASKTLTDTQCRYSQIQEEALAVIYGLQKFHQFLYVSCSVDARFGASWTLFFLLPRMMPKIDKQRKLPSRNEWNTASQYPRLTWRRHIKQLRSRYGVEEDVEPGEAPTLLMQHRNNKQKQDEEDALRQVKRPIQGYQC
ncbi:hypothetical protein O3P69_013280 [Scylla paramamosain]|uniref:Reverse transcriptase/retrotransposon-derived protein RNase H-like domain-containing protein n=1 Tax=Scylla paramamosain TaxID=85552 RepID=A0AAW0TZB3_SCYPA